MYSVCDNECNYYLMIDLIVDYRNNYKAITVPYEKVFCRGCSFMRISIVGWQLCAQCRDGPTSWNSLKYLKESRPVETEEYTVAK